MSFFNSDELIKEAMNKKMEQQKKEEELKKEQAQEEQHRKIIVNNIKGYVAEALKEFPELAKKLGTRTYEVKKMSAFGRRSDKTVKVWLLPTWNIWSNVYSIPNKGQEPVMDEKGNLYHVADKSMVFSPKIGSSYTVYYYEKISYDEAINKMSEKMYKREICVGQEKNEVERIFTMFLKNEC